MNYIEIKDNTPVPVTPKEIKIDQTYYLVTSSHVGTTSLEYILVNWMVNKAVQS